MAKQSKPKTVATIVVAIKELQVNPNNPRLIKDDKFKSLVESVKSFPDMLSIRPIVVNKEMVILGGNMRYRACVEAGLKEVPVIVVDLTPEQEKEFLIKDNVSGGEWDFDMLANEWDALKLEEWGLDVVAKQDWGKIDYIDEELNRPASFNKANTITVTVPEAFTEEVKDIEQLIKDTLQEKYSGCEVK